MVGQPQEYLISAIQAKDLEISELKRLKSAVDAQVKEMEAEVTVLRRDNRQMRQDMKIVLMQSYESTKLKGLVAG